MHDLGRRPPGPRVELGFQVVDLVALRADHGGGPPAAIAVALDRDLLDLAAVRVVRPLLVDDEPDGVALVDVLERLCCVVHQSCLRSICSTSR